MTASSHFQPASYRELPLRDVQNCRVDPLLRLRITYESAAAHASRTSSGSHLSAPYGRRDSGVGGPGSHARPSAAFECYPARRRATEGSGRLEAPTEPPRSPAKPAS